MPKTLFGAVALFFIYFSFSAHAQSASIDWSFRNSSVVCGGVVDGQNLKMHVVTPGELMAGESENGRFLVYIDLHKVGQVRWVMSDAISDEDYDKREASLAKLTPEEAELIRKLTATRTSDIYMGMIDGFVTMSMVTSKGQSASLSCKEIPNRNQGAMVGE